MDAVRIAESKRFGRFLILGVGNTLIDFGLMNLFAGVFHIPLLISQALSFLIAVTNSYFLNRAWVYSDLNTPLSGLQFTKFLVINLAGLGIRSIGISPLNNWFGKLIDLSADKTLLLNKAFLSRNVALGIIIPITLILNYLANRFWTFRPAENGRTLDSSPE